MTKVTKIQTQSDDTVVDIAQLRTDVISDLARGMPMAEAAQKHRTSVAQIERIRTMNRDALLSKRIEINDSTTVRWSEVEQNNLYDMVAVGMPFDAISDVLGRTVSALRVHLTISGISTRLLRHSAPTHHKRIISAINDTAVPTVSSIANNVGLSTDAVAWVMTNIIDQDTTVSFTYVTETNELVPSFGPFTTDRFRKELLTRIHAYVGNSNA